MKLPATLLERERVGMVRALQQRGISPEQIEGILDAVVILMDKGYLSLTDEVQEVLWAVWRDMEDGKIPLDVGLAKILFTMTFPEHSRTYHIDEYEASHIVDYHELEEWSYRQIAYITGRSLETLHRVVQESENKQTSNPSACE